MTEEYNSFLKSSEELDFDLEGNSRALNNDISRNSPKDYIILNEEIESSIKEDTNIDISYVKDECERSYFLRDK